MTVSEMDGAVSDQYRLLATVFLDLPCEVVDALEAHGGLEKAQGSVATTMQGCSFETSRCRSGSIDRGGTAAPLRTGHADDW